MTKTIIIPKDAELIRQTIILHNNSLVYEETRFTIGNSIWLSFAYKGTYRYTTLKGEMFDCIALRKEQLNLMFGISDIKLGMNEAHNVIRDCIAKDMNIDSKNLNIIHIFTGLK